MKVDRNTYSKSRPVIKPSDIAPSTHAIFTITSVEEVNFDDQPKLVIQFAEFPEHSYYPNVTSIDAMIEGLGDESDKWLGKRVPLHVVQTNNPTTHKQTPALWVVPANEWDQHIGRRGGNRPAVSRAPAAKRGGKKTAR